MNNTNTQIENLGGLKKNISGTESQSDEINVPQKINDLEKRADDVEKNFEKLDKRIKNSNNFMMWMTGIIVGVFFVTGVAIMLDYFKYNEERYEKFIDKTEEIKNNLYTNEDLKETIEENEKNKNILNCLKIKEYFDVKCFE